MTMPAPVAGEERAELIAALDSLKAFAQAFNSRGISTSYVRALECFDAMRARACNDRPTIDAQLLERINGTLQWGVERGREAVSVDVADLQQLLTHLRS